MLETFGDVGEILLEFLDGSGFKSPCVAALGINFHRAIVVVDRPRSVWK